MIDAHHHLWSDPATVPWIHEADLAPLQRSFESSDWESTVPTSVTGSVLVEAGTGDPTELTRLLDVAERTPLVQGVVGWVDTSAAPDAVAAAVQAAFVLPGAQRWLKGLRIQAQAQPAEHLDGDASRVAATCIAEHRSVLEVVSRPEHLFAASRLARRIDGTPFVLDHAGKPDIARGSGNDFRAWHDGMCRLSDTTSSVVKISGLVTEASWSRWTVADLRPYVATLLDLFGPGRLMVGSDWPVCLVAGSYDRVVEAMLACLEELSADELARVVGGTATRVYSLELR